jgi:HEPN domain-containing protein
MNPIDHAKLLLLMASKDMKALDIMIMPESVDDEIFGFHAQQAVEKTLKAWISLAGGAYAKSHDLSMLLLTLQALGCDIENFKDLILLNAFAAQFRYEALETDDEPLDRQEMRVRVQHAFDTVQVVLRLIESRQVGIPARPEPAEER